MSPETVVQQPTEFVKQPEIPTSPGKHNVLRLLVLIVGIIVIIGISMVIGVQLGKNQNTVKQLSLVTPTVNPDQTTGNPIAIPSTADRLPDADTEKWQTFKSQLGFSFEYPAGWGIPEESIVDALSTGQGDSGKVYALRFSSNSKIYGAGISADFSAGRGGMRSDFLGYKNESKNIKSYLDIVDPGCYTMGGQNSFLGNIDFNLPGKEIPGVRLFFPILSNVDYTKILNTYGLNNFSEDFCNNEEQHQKYIQIGTEIKETILTKKNIDKDSISNLDMFNRVAGSSKID